MITTVIDENENIHSQFAGVSMMILDSSFIVLSGDSVASDATVGTVVGTLSVTAAYTGTPIWQLVNDENGKFAVNSSTGVVTVAGDLSALDSASIKAKVRGISQQIFDRTFELTLSGGGGGSSPEALFSADFKNGVYSFGGLPVAVTDMFAAGDGWAFDAETDIEAGVGLKSTANPLLAGSTLTTALTGVTFVVSISAAAATGFGLTIDVIDASFNGMEGTVQASELAIYNYFAEDPFQEEDEDLVAHLVAGSSKFALTWDATTPAMAASYNGSASISISPVIPGTPDRVGITLNSPIIIEKIEAFAVQANGDLAGLTAP